MACCYNCMKEYSDGFDICPHCGYDNGNAETELYYLKPGTWLSEGRYQIGREENAGGFGIVYRAWDKVLGKLIAIKEYFPASIATRIPDTGDVRSYSEKNLREFESGKQKFLSEARKVAKFNNHPNIVDVYDFFEDHQTAYMVMEFMDGMIYKEYIRKQGGTVSQQIAISVALAVLDALKEVHKEKIIHRDINPNNIFICKNGVVKLFDFGAARFEQGEMTSVLTPHYAPPEQYSTGGKQGPYTDIYSVGATMYFALTGVKPEESSDRIQKDSLVPPSQLDPSIPQPLSNAIMRAMALRPELRFQNTDQFKEAITSTKKKVLDVEAELKRRRKIRVIQISSTLAVLGVAAGMCVLYYQNQREAATLQATDLNIWVMADSNDTEESARQRFLDVSESFCESYPQVEMEITVYQEEEYRKNLNQAAEAGTLPDVFDSTWLDPSYDEKLVPLKVTCDMMGDWSDYLFLEDYEEMFPEQKKMPLCFQIPVVYAKKGLNETEEERILTADQIMQGTYSMKAEDFYLYSSWMGEEGIETWAQIAEEHEKSVTEDGLEMFRSGEVEYYLSDTGDYQWMTEEMPAEFEVMFPSMENDMVSARFDHLWSVNSEADPARIKAGQWLIYYMMSDSAQSVLAVRNLEGIPLSRQICDVFMDVYQNELSRVGDFQSVVIGGDEWEKGNKEYMGKWRNR